MSDSEATPKLRRSTRERKSTKLFSQESRASDRKRKRGTDDEGGNTTDKTISEGLGIEDDQEDAREEENEEDPDDYTVRRAKPYKPSKTSAGTSEAKTKTKTIPIKKIKTTKAKGDAPRKTKPDASIDIAAHIKESHILDDNALFLLILNPSSNLQSVVEDFLESLSTSPELALQDLVNCILRASGCNELASSAEVADLDGVIDTLDTYTDNLKQRAVPPYPLISRLPVFKKLRKQLSEFFHRLISASAETGSLYTSDLLPTLIPWVSSMSSSQLRSFRHTATVAAMELSSALCQVATEIEKEHAIVTRQHQGEKKRAGKNQGKARDKEFEAKAEEVGKRKDKTAEYIEDFFNGVFVHRYRDHDPGIRTECVQALGSWFKSYPSRFMDVKYFRYVGWVLSDADTHVRLAAVKSLHTLYLSSSSAVSIQSFTDRFKGRLLQMATSDLELSIRVATLQTLALIEKASLLEEDQRDELCLLIYDEESRVRKAVAGFVQNVWTEAVEEWLSEHTLQENKKKDKSRVGLKCLASLFVKWGKRTRQGLLSEGLINNEDEDEDEMDENIEESKNRDVMRLVDAQQKGRIALAVDALWDDLPPVAEWETLLDYLLLDHSAPETNDVVGPSSRRVAKKMTEDEYVDDAWRLSETEETALLQLFVASLRKAKDEALLQKAEGETVLSDMTRALIKALPRLFAKHQTDSNRIADVLLIPPLMNLDLYLEMRMVPAYESLWDDIIKQFNSHSSPITLNHAAAAIQHLMSARLLVNINTAKQLELEEELSTSLRDAVAGREELEMADFTEDEIHKLGAISARLVILASFRDITQWMEEDEGGKQSSAWDIMNALAGRGRLGLKEEEVMIEECLRLLTLHLAWKSRHLSLELELTKDVQKFKEVLEEQRNSVLEKVIEFAVGKDSKPCEGVKRAAFHNLLDLHILFNGASDAPPSALPLTMDDQTQYRCAGFVQAELEQFADDLQDPKKDLGHTTDEDESRAGSTTAEEDANEKKNQDEPRGRIPRGEREDSVDPRTLPQTRLEREYILNSVLAAFIRALRVGVLNPAHCVVVLAQYGRFGLGFDSTIKIVIDFLRDLGMFKEEGHLVSEIIVRSLQESFNLFMDDVVHTDDNTVALARALTSCFVIRGAQLSIVKRLGTEHIANIHKSCISWIVKRCAGYEAAKNQKLLRHAVLFFRSLQHLLSTIESRDALTIKAQLDQYIAQVNLQINTKKTWDPYRAYEKRLINIMQKDKSIPVSKPKRRKKNGEAGTDDEVVGEAGESAGSATEADAPERPPRPKPRPKKTRPRRGSVASATGNEGDDEDVFESASRPSRVRSPSKRLYTKKPKAGPNVEITEANNTLNGNSLADRPANGHVSSPSPQRKRQRFNAGHSERGSDPEPEGEQAISPARSYASATGTKSRRKRIRR